MKPHIFEDLKTMLEFYQALGLEGIPVALRETKEPPFRDLKLPGNERVSDKDTGVAAADKELLLRALREEIGDCTRCKLSRQRKNIVFGEGASDARLMFIGEAPGREEDLQGRPFVGEAGMLLTKLIEKMGLKRDGVYIANIVKCRPPMNRDPEGDETSSCRAFIDRQIEIIGPKVIITLGRVALQVLMGNRELKITAVRGKFLEYKGIPVMPTFHPAYLLRNPGDKWKTWADAQKVMERLDKEG